MTMLLLTLLIAIVAQLTTATSVEAAILHRRAQRLAHELAVDSALILIADRLQESPQLEQALDRQGSAEMSFTVGSISVAAFIQDDGSKLSLLPWSLESDGAKLTHKLAMLGGSFSLSTPRIELRPLEVGTTRLQRYRWFDQLFTDAQPGQFIRLDDHRENKVWSDAVTFWGDGRIDLRRVSAQVLEVALEDIQPGLASRILAARPKGLADNALDVALTPVHAELRQQVASRLAYNLHRYSLELTTSAHADRKRWYIVATIQKGRCDVLHRSQVTW